VFQYSTTELILAWKLEDVLFPSLDRPACGTDYTV